MTGCGGTAAGEGALDHTSKLILECETDGGSIKIQGISDEEDTSIVEIDGEIVHKGVIYYSPNGKFHAYFDNGLERHIVFSESHWVYVEALDDTIFRDDTGYIVERDGKVFKYEPCLEGSVPMNIDRLRHFSVATEDVFLHGEALVELELDGTPLVQAPTD